jgi:DNA-binding HxlR family transcriptional regulator
MTIANIDLVSKIIGDKWTLPIILSMSQGNTRYCKLEHDLGINPRTLADRLEKLTSIDLIQKYINENDPRKICYSLTSRGESLLPIISDLAAWQEDNLSSENTHGSCDNDC